MLPPDETIRMRAHSLELGDAILLDAAEHDPRRGDARVDQAAKLLVRHGWLLRLPRCELEPIDGFAHRAVWNDEKARIERASFASPSRSR
mgnify:CR=1 FL=1